MTAPNHSQSDRAERHEQSQPHAHASSARKPFVEPVISSPVDVLAATTFFQVVDSGTTLRRPRGE